jgi:hypothetical protein
MIGIRFMNANDLARHTQADLGTHGTGREYSRRGPGRSAPLLFFASASNAPLYSINR